MREVPGIWLVSIQDQLQMLMDFSSDTCARARYLISWMVYILISWSTDNTRGSACEILVSRIHGLQHHSWLPGSKFYTIRSSRIDAYQKSSMGWFWRKYKFKLNRPLHASEIKSRTLSTTWLCSGRGIWGEAHFLPLLQPIWFRWFFDTRQSCGFSLSDLVRR